MEEIRRLNWSTLRYMETSPRLLRWRIEHPRPDMPSLRLGRAIHCILLEPEKFETQWISIMPCAALKKDKTLCGSGGTLFKDGSWYCKVKGHAPEGAGDPPKGLEIISEEERALALICADRVRSHKEAVKLLQGGAAEQELEWEDPETGIACRGRLDYLRPEFLVDIKTTRRETVREFSMDAARHLYHCQLAWYHFGAIQAGRIPADAPAPYIVSVSTAEPYDVAVFQLSKSTLLAGQIRCRDLLLKYVTCQKSGIWPGIAPDLLTLELPQWAAGMNGGEGDESNEW